MQGILVDQWKLWEERTGVKVVISALPWGEALQRMTAGEFDVIDTIFYTDERARSFRFYGLPTLRSMSPFSSSIIFRASPMPAT